MINIVHVEILKKLAFSNVAVSERNGLSQTLFETGTSLLEIEINT